MRDGSEIVFGASDEEYRYVYRHVANGGQEGVWAKYDIGCELGRGAFGCVVRASERATGGSTPLRSYIKLIT